MNPYQKSVGSDFECKILTPFARRRTIVVVIVSLDVVECTVVDDDGRICSSHGR